MRPKNEKKYNIPKPNKRQRVMNLVYLVSLLLVFECICLMFLVFPRSTHSTLEKRDLAEFPELNSENYFSGKFTEDVGNWFSDTVPFRDELTQMSTSIRDLRGFRKDGITLHGVTGAPESGTSSGSDTPKKPESKPQTTTPVLTLPLEPETEQPVSTEPAATEPVSAEPEQTTTSQNHEISPVEQQVNEDDAVNITNNGIAVVGNRALMLYGGSFSVGEQYAGVINKYKEVLGDSVNVYSMIIPTSCEFYSPPSVQAYCGSQLDNINHVIEFLRNDVRAVDVYSTLAEHTSEDIYLRTDHHWAALGAYYAAKEFAAAAGVPFADLSEYDMKVVHDYVGTMYAYSDYDTALKNSPEDFCYYVPKNVDYTATYYNYTLDGGKIVGASEPFEADFFIKYADGNNMAYCTYMGGDAKIVHVKSDAGTGRKLAILKDSYGNALPQFLFGSFDDIYVIDMRYFTHNIVDYFSENGITDVLFANNAFHAATASTVTYYENFLTQKDWGF